MKVERENKIFEFLKSAKHDVTLDTIIKRDIKDMEEVIKKGPVYTLDSVEDFLEDIWSETIILTDLKASCETHIYSTQSEYKDVFENL